VRNPKVPRTRNLASLTEAGFWGMVRSGLRRTFRYWKPALAALRMSRVDWPGPHGRQYGYRCAGCGKIFSRKEVEIDHKLGAGSLTDYAHVGEFLRRLTPETPEDFQVLCKGKGSCHQMKTNSER
jgi:hypothetical protein